MRKSSCLVFGFVLFQGIRSRSKCTTDYAVIICFELEDTLVDSVRGISYDVSTCRRIQNHDSGLAALSTRIYNQSACVLGIC